MKDNLTTTVIKERHKRKPIKEWCAYEIRLQVGRSGYCVLIDRHESIAILRARNNPNCIFKAIR